MSYSKTFFFVTLYKNTEIKIANETLLLSTNSNKVDVGNCTAFNMSIFKTYIVLTRYINTHCASI